MGWVARPGPWLLRPTRLLGTSTWPPKVEAAGAGTRTPEDDVRSGGSYLRPHCRHDTGKVGDDDKGHGRTTFGRTVSEPPVPPCQRCRHGRQYSISPFKFTEHAQKRSFVRKNSQKQLCPAPALFSILLDTGSVSSKEQRCNRLQDKKKVLCTHG